MSTNTQPIRRRREVLDDVIVAVMLALVGTLGGLIAVNVALG